MGWTGGSEGRGALIARLFHNVSHYQPAITPQILRCSMTEFDFSCHKQRSVEYYAVYLDRFKTNPKRIFEMGSGIGLFLEACMRKGICALGCELSMEGVELARSRGVRVYQHDLSDPITFVENDSFDAVFCNQVIEHVNTATQKNIVKEAYRILKPGGEFLVQSPCRHFEAARKDKHHINLLTPLELKALLESHGFVKCNMGYNRPQEISPVPQEVIQELWERYHPDFFSQTATVLAIKSLSE